MTNLKPASFLISVSLVLTFGFSCPLFAQTESYYLDTLEVYVRREIGGVTYNFQLHIDLKNPDEGREEGWGTARRIRGDDRTKTNCQEELYDYTVVDLDENWTIPKFINDALVIFSQADNKAFWDWYYDGYDAVGGCDYTQNCHGYAFGVGDWPDNATKILNIVPVPDPPPPGWVNPSCYVLANKADAEIAADPLIHAIKVQSGSCLVPHDGGGLEPPGPILTTVLVSSSEQFRESGVYTQSSTCPDEIDLYAAGRPELDVHATLDLSLYEKN